MVKSNMSIISIVHWKCTTEMKIGLRFWERKILNLIYKTHFEMPWEFGGVGIGETHI